MELHREEKREKGDRGDQEEKRGNQKERDIASNQFPKCSEGDQPWDFFGRNDAEAEAPVLWPPHEKS